MKTQVYFGIAFRLILLFVVAMLATFLPEHLREFFGDTLHDCGIKCSTMYGYCNRHEIDQAWDWGTRHYWYLWMMISLFLLSLINLIVSIYNLVNKHYKL